MRVGLPYDLLRFSPSSADLCGRRAAATQPAAAGAPRRLTPVKSATPPLTAPALQDAREVASAAAALACHTYNTLILHGE